MSSMKLTEGPRREAREDAGSLEALRKQLSQQVHETAAAKGEVAALTLYIADQMGPMVDEMAKKAQQITHQLQLRDATIEQLTSQCQQTDAALRSSAEVSAILLIHSTASLGCPRVQRCGLTCRCTCCSKKHTEICRNVTSWHAEV